MIQATSTNCSPIKPQIHQSFGNREVMAATADWLDTVDGELTEDSFIGLQDITQKMNDGPLKTFAKILAIGGASFAAIKTGSSKIVGKVANNATIQKTVTKPVTKFVSKGLETIGNKVRNSQYFGENVKGFKAYIVNTAEKALKGIENYGQRGSEALTQNIDAQLTKARGELKKAKSQIKKDQLKETIASLVERKKYAATENLITKVSTTTAATGAGAAAIVEANKDRDGDGVADIGQHY